MSFSKDINKFVDSTTQKMKEMTAESEEQANNILVEIMGNDLGEIKAITFDMELGKFRDIEAPEFVKEKLREKNLLTE
jgi:mannitol-specific phosphotransferase system IIBC component